jgi:hypothetical protein
VGVDLGVQLALPTLRLGGRSAPLRRADPGRMPARGRRAGRLGMPACHAHRGRAHALPGLGRGGKAPGATRPGGQLDLQRLGVDRAPCPAGRAGRPAWCRVQPRRAGEGARLLSRRGFVPARGRGSEAHPGRRLASGHQHHDSPSQLPPASPVAPVSHRHRRAHLAIAVRYRHGLHGRKSRSGRAARGAAVADSADRGTVLRQRQSDQSLRQRPHGLFRQARARPAHRRHLHAILVRLSRGLPCHRHREQRQREGLPFAAFTGPGREPLRRGQPAPEQSARDLEPRRRLCLQPRISCRATGRLLRRVPLPRHLPRRLHLDHVRRITDAGCGQSPLLLSPSGQARPQRPPRRRAHRRGKGLLRLAAVRSQWPPVGPARGRVGESVSEFVWGTRDAWACA